MNPRALISFILLGSIISSCTKEESEENAIPIDNTCDYAPYTIGSTFVYQQSGIDPTDTFTHELRVHGDTIVDNNTYRMLKDDKTGHTSFSQCRGDMYTQLMSADRFPNVPPGRIRTHYLYTNIPKGGGWSEELTVTYPGMGELTLIVNYTVTTKDSTKVVLGKEYKDVIGVRTDVSVPPLISNEQYGTTYYAKGVGVIQLETAEDTIRLKSYNIR